MKNIETKNRFLMLAIISTLAALGVHFYLTQHYYDLKFGTSEGNSVCNINAVFNCDAVTASKYAAFLGIPVALWGFATNLVLLYILAITRFNLVQDRARVSRYGFLLASLTMLASVVMGMISLTALGTACVFCMAAYALSLITFFGAWKGSENLERASLASDIRAIGSSDRWLSYFLIGIPAIAFVGNEMIVQTSQYGEIDKVVQETIAYWSTAPQQNFDMKQGLVLQNGTGAPIMTLVEFADFRCPHCKAAAPTLHAFVNSHQNTQLIFKPFPLDGTCNTALKGGDGISCGLAFSVMCAEKLAKKGWAAHDYIFENQIDIARAENLNKNLEDISTKLGIKAEDLKACVNSSETVDQVRKMADEGAAAKIEGTPSIFANGKLLNRGQTLPVLEGVYRYLQGN